MELLNAIVATGNMESSGVWPMSILLLGGPGAVLVVTSQDSEFDPALYWHYQKGSDCLWKKIRRNIFIIWMQKMTHRYR